MALNDHRARFVVRARGPVVAATMVLALALATVSVVVLLPGDRPSEQAQDVTGLTEPGAPVGPITGATSEVDDVARVPSAPRSDDSSDTQRVRAEERDNQRLLDAAVARRSQALVDLVARAQEKAVEDAKVQERREEKVQAASSAPFTLTIGSFNVLGSQHTAPGGDRSNFPPASVRSAGAINRMAAHGVDIVGMQEIQDDQLRTIQSGTGMAAYPGFEWGVAETDNSILYDDARFEFVSGDRFIIPFMGRPRPQPILRLRERATGREFYVVNTHPSAHDGPYLAERRQGQAALVSVVNGLKASGLPVLVTGDMNDRELFYCNVVPQAGLTASNGGSYGSGCQPPPGSIPVDWVVGSGVSWSGYQRDTTPVTSRISDHFFISAVASIT